MGAPYFGSYIRLIYTMHHSYSLNLMPVIYHLPNLNFCVINKLYLFSFLTTPNLPRSTRLLMKCSLTLVRLYVSSSKWHGCIHITSIHQHPPGSKFSDMTSFPWIYLQCFPPPSNDTRWKCPRSYLCLLSFNW